VRHPQLQDGRLREGFADILVGDPAVMMPSERSPHSMRFPSNVSANSRSARIRSSTTAWRWRALTGSITHFPGSSTNPRGICDGSTAPNPTTPVACETRVVVRRKTGRVETLRQGEGQLRVFLGFRRVGRLQHRDLGRDGVVPVVLLVLGRVHLGIVSRDDD